MESPWVVPWRPEALDCRVPIPPEASELAYSYPGQSGTRTSDLLHLRADPEPLNYRCNLTTRVTLTCLTRPRLLSAPYAASANSSSTRSIPVILSAKKANPESPPDRTRALF